MRKRLLGIKIGSLWVALVHVTSQLKNQVSWDVQSGSQSFLMGRLDYTSEHWINFMGNTDGYCKYYYSAPCLKLVHIGSY